MPRTPSQNEPHHEDTVLTTRFNCSSHLERWHTPGAALVPDGRRDVWSDGPSRRPVVKRRWRRCPRQLVRQIQRRDFSSLSLMATPPSLPSSDQVGGRYEGLAE